MEKDILKQITQDVAYIQYNLNNFSGQELFEALRTIYDARNTDGKERFTFALIWCLQMQQLKKS